MKNTFAIIMALYTLLLNQNLAQTNKTNEWKTWSEKPPMGWNSYDAYHGAITEEQFLKCVDKLAEDLLPYGWEYATIDYCWFHPGPEGWDPVQKWSPFKLH